LPENEQLKDVVFMSAVKAVQNKVSWSENPERAA